MTSEQITTRKLVNLYRDMGRRFVLTGDQFKMIAGRGFLKEGYYSNVNSALQKKGYVLIEMPKVVKKMTAFGVLKIETSGDWGAPDDKIMKKYTS